jgi:hypothetical protein
LTALNSCVCFLKDSLEEAAWITSTPVWFQAILMQLAISEHVGRSWKNIQANFATKTNEFAI